MQVVRADKVLYFRRLCSPPASPISSITYEAWGGCNYEGRRARSTRLHLFLLQEMPTSQTEGG